MLITPIWPKMMARPSAISSSTQKTDRPLKPCMAKMAPNSDSEVMGCSWVCLMLQRLQGVRPTLRQVPSPLQGGEAGVSGDTSPAGGTVRACKHVLRLRVGVVRLSNCMQSLDLRTPIPAFPLSGGRSTPRGKNAYLLVFNRSY